MEARDNARLVGHVQRDADYAVAPEFLHDRLDARVERLLVDVGQHHTGAFAQ